jgi:hypothetical protein
MNITSMGKLIVYVLAIALSGCALTSSVNRERSLNNNKAIFVDAKQRGIYAVKRTTEQKNGNGEQKIIWEAFCAEPSPDAISSLASTLGVDFTLTDKGKLGFSKSSAEGVGSIGLRTAAIEALRDIMYRNCEAYAMGAISPYGIETLQRRFQSTMVAILAIEQLTGAVRAPAVVLSGNSSAGSPDAIVDLTNRAEASSKSLDNAKAAEEKSKKKYLDAEKARKESESKLENDKGKYEEAKKTPSDENKKIVESYEKLLVQHDSNKDAEDLAKKEYETAQESTKRRQQEFDAIDSSRLAALANGGAAGSTGSFQSPNSTQGLSGESAQHVSDAVYKIVEQTVGLNFGNEFCVTILGASAGQEIKEGTAEFACLILLFEARNDSRQTPNQPPPPTDTTESQGVTEKRLQLFLNNK